MAVLFITHKYPPATGGMENQSYQLINGYQKKEPCFTIIHEGKESIIWFFLRLRHRVSNVLRAHPEITAIHMNDGLMAAFFIGLHVNPAGRKLLATIHGLDVVFPSTVYQKVILPHMVKKITTFICVSKATKKACLDRGFPIDKLVVVRNGVDGFSPPTVIKTTFNIPNVDLTHDKIILAIGRPVKRKGFSWFAKEVMPLLPHEYKFVHIGHIAENGSWFYRILPKKVKQLYDLFTGRANDISDLILASKNPTNKTILAGKLSDEEKMYAIQQAHVMVMPNIYQPGDMEGFGLVALEGSVMGKVVLAADLEGITDAIQHSKNGFLIKSGHAASWATKIEQLEISALQKTQFREFTIQNYSWSKMVDEYFQVIQGRTT